MNRGPFAHVVFTGFGAPDSPGYPQANKRRSLAAFRQSQSARAVSALLGQREDHQYEVDDLWAQQPLPTGADMASAQAESLQTAGNQVSRARPKSSPPGKRRWVPRSYVHVPCHAMRGVHASPALSPPHA